MRRLSKIICLLLLLAASLSGQVPVNDLRENASELVLANTTLLTGDITGATESSSDPSIPIPGRVRAARSVWFQFTSDQDQVVQFSNLKSDVTNWVLVAHRIDGEVWTPAGYIITIHNSVNGRVTSSFRAKKGEKFIVLIGDFGSQEDPVFKFSVRAITENIPVNDDQSNAIDLGRQFFHDVPGTLHNASIEPGGPGQRGITGRGIRTANVWYTWTAPRTGKVGMYAKYQPKESYELPSIELFFRQLNPRPVIGNPGPRAEFRLTPAAEAKIDVVEGYTYLIGAEREAPTSSGSGFSFSILDLTPPENDSPDTAIDLGSPEELSLESTTREATLAPIEREVLDVSYGTVGIWYRWKAPSTGVYDVSLTSSENRMSVSLAWLKGSEITRQRPKLIFRGSEQAANRVFFKEGESWTVLVATSGMNNSSLGTRGSGRFHLSINKLSSETSVEGDLLEAPLPLPISQGNSFKRTIDLTNATADGNDPSTLISYDIVAGFQQSERNVWLRIPPGRGGVLAFTAINSQGVREQIRVYEKTQSGLNELSYGHIFENSDSVIGVQAADLGNGTEYYVEIIANRDGEVQFLAEMEKPRYQLFKRFNFGNEALNNPLGDADRDGMSNLMEYVLMTQPLDERNFSVDQGVVINRVSKTIEFPGYHLRSLPDIEYELEHSTGLSGSWQRVPGVQYDQEQFGSLLFQLPQDSPPMDFSGFYRVKVSLKD